MAEVALRNIVKTFDRTPAVAGIDLDISDREFVVLVGPSGCGKTTTLRMIAGLEDVTDGEIYIGDRLVNDVPPKDRDIAMVFQNYALKRRHVAAEATDQRVRSAAHMLSVMELLDRTPRALSGGQRQRVAVG